MTSEYQSGTSSRRTGNAGSGGFKPSGVDVTTFPGFGALRSLPRSEQGPQGAPRVESVGAAPATGPSDATARLGVRPRGVPLYVCRIWTATGPPAHAGHRVRVVAPRLRVLLAGRRRVHLRGKR